MAELNPPELRLIGTIVRPHGNDGALQVDLSSTIILERGTRVWVGYSKQYCREYTLQSFTHYGKRAILRFNGITTRHQAEQLREHGVFVTFRLEQAHSEPSSLLGWLVMLDDGTQLGTVNDIEENPAHPLLCIEHPLHGNVRIPLVDAFVQHSNPLERVVILTLPDGLLDAQQSSVPSRKRKR